MLSPRARKGLFAGGAALALLVALYAAAGYLLAPRLIRDALLERAARAGLQAQVEAIDTHPFALTLDAYDVQLATNAGERLLHAQRVSLDFAWSSLWRRAWVIERLAVVRPVLTAWPSFAGGGADSGSPPRIFVSQATLSEGAIALARVPPLEGVALHVAGFSTLASEPASFEGSATVGGAGTVRTAGTLAPRPFQLSGKLEVSDAPLVAAWRYLPKSAGEPPKGRIGGALDYRYANGRFALANSHAEARLDSGGRLAARGELRLEPFAADLHLEAGDLPLALAQRFLPQETPVRIAAGALSGQGRLRLGDATRYDGAVALGEASLEDPRGELLLGWQQLATQELHLQLSPFSLQAGELVATAPRGRVVIGPKGELNLAQAFLPGKQDAKAPGLKWNVAVGRLRVEQGEVNFADRSLDTPFATTVRDLAGAVSGISTGSDEPARVQLAGRVGEYGDARLLGAIDLDAPASRTSLQLRFRNLALPDFTPYAAKFAGYRIEGGRLSAELRYRVRDGRLVGDNELEFDRLKLGEKVDSPSALDLPVDLAVALLTDAQGRINLAIPVRGDLRDPQFDLGGLIAKALRNTLGKIVSAPFRLLASLFGSKGGEGLDEVRFDPGSAELSPPQQETLARLAKALAERPRLALSIRGSYDPQADAQALRRQALLRELARRAGYRAAAGGSAPPAPVNAADPRIVRAAERLYLLRGADALGLSGLKPREPGYARRLLAALAEHTALAPDAVPALAAQRAAAVRDALVKSGVASGRVALEPPGEAEAGKEGVPTALALSPA